MANELAIVAAIPNNNISYLGAARMVARWITSPSSIAFSTICMA
jgi:hypothetical protein